MPTVASAFDRLLPARADLSRRALAWNLTEKLTGIVWPRLEGIALARWLGPAEFGSASLLLYAACLVEIPFRNAPVTTLSYFVCRKTEARSLYRPLALWQCAWVLVFVAAWASGWLANHMAAGLFVMALSMAAEPYFTGPLCGRLAWEPFARARTFGWLARLALLLLLLTRGWGVGAVVLAYAAGSAASTLLALRGLRALPARDAGAERPIEGAARPARFALARAALLGAALVMRRHSLYLVTRLAPSAEQVGLFAGALSLSGAVLYVWYAASAWIVPEFTRCSRDGDAGQFHRVFVKNLGPFALMTAVALAGVAVLAQPLLRLLYGGAFVAAAPIVGTLAAGQAVLALHFFFSARLWEEPWAVFGINVAAAAAQALLCERLIPARGIQGAAWACAASWLLAAVVSGSLAWRRGAAA